LIAFRLQFFAERLTASIMDMVIHESFPARDLKAEGFGSNQCVHGLALFQVAEVGFGED
jgi:hypothetical protein